MTTRLTPADAGSIIAGSSVHTAEELCLAVIRYAFGHGMPVVSVSDNTAGRLFDVADKSVVDDTHCGDWEAIEWFGESLGDCANDAQEWLNESVAPDGHAFVWDDGLVLVLDSES